MSYKKDYDDIKTIDDQFVKKDGRISLIPKPHLFDTKVQGDSKAIALKYGHWSWVDTFSMLPATASEFKGLFGSINL